MCILRWNEDWWRKIPRLNLIKMLPPVHHLLSLFFSSAQHFLFKVNKAWHEQHLHNLFNNTSGSSDGFYCIMYRPTLIWTLKFFPQRINIYLILSTYLIVYNISEPQTISSLYLVTYLRPWVRLCLLCQVVVLREVDASASPPDSLCHTPSYHRYHSVITTW